MVIKNKQYPAILYGYLKKYQQDPTSRVFAPLAESYRKVGLVDEAIEIAREGLQIHPGFVGGRVALARALFDKKLYDEVVKELIQVVRDVPDNLVAQKLIAESYLMLGSLVDALGAFKMLLYFSPNDREISQIVKELETDAYKQGEATLCTDTKFEVRQAAAAIGDDPSAKHSKWIQKIEFLQILLQKVERYRARSLLA